MRRLVVVTFVLTVTSPMIAGPRPAPQRLEIASGVFVFVTAPYGGVGLDGNSIVVLSNDGVLVFDSNGTPAAAAAVLAEIRRLTPQPVRYVVHSHWHWDHWYGAEVYKRAFPDVKVVAHEKTRALMAGPAIAFNKPGLETQLPNYIRSLEKRIADAEAASPPSTNLPAMREALEDARYFLEQKNSVTPTLPDITFTDRLDFTLGEREVQLLNFGRGVTPGDAVLFLRRERIAAIGDLVVNPITFALSGYPTEWVRALERLDQLPVDVMVSGHGAPLRDRRLLHSTLEVFRQLLKEGKAARARGLDADEARDSILPTLQPLMLEIAGDHPESQAAFRTQLVDWFLHRVYDELAGPLTDDIAPIPPR
jgi:glyoxylase-like metal-dependent hydrolase (beta-lactamase superfamily II)